MPWYTLDEAINTVDVPTKWEKQIVCGGGEVAHFIGENLARQVKSGGPYLAILDGFLGVDWQPIIDGITECLKSQDMPVECADISSCLKSPDSIENMVLPCLKADECFGRVFDGKLGDFFDKSKLADLRGKIKKCRQGKHSVVVVYGCGASLAAVGSRTFFYFDTCREKITELIEEQTIRPIGSVTGSLSAQLPFKRLYYVDYGVLNKHKRSILKQMDFYIDANAFANSALLPKDVFDGLLAKITHQPIRPKPVYMSGVWGGQEMKSIRGLPGSMVNCAFALELIPQEQSVRIAAGSAVIEMPFMNLVWREPVGIMGEAAARKFGNYFPVTLNYDDTSQGGHLAIQVHPNGRYLKNKFNERMRRDESYYCVKAWDGARTYHGIKEQTDLRELRQLCARAEDQGVPFDHDQYINSWQSKPGDLFLIPAGTVHASGHNQLVLEIDTDPSRNAAEYTFHLYDYLRPNLDGSKRAIHLNHAFNVIRPWRRTNWVKENLKQEPRLLRSGEGWAEYLLGRRPEMCHEIRRFEIERRIEDDTHGEFHILTLVSGESVRVSSRSHPERSAVIKFTETLLIPAGLGKYVVENLGDGVCKLTKALLRTDEYTK